MDFKQKAKILLWGLASEMLAGVAIMIFWNIGLKDATGHDATFIECFTVVCIVSCLAAVIRGRLELSDK
jgi:uncharacterized membrane protein